jgi:hypothetical protein
MTWTYVYTPLSNSSSGNDTQTVTFHVGLTGLDPTTGQFTGNTSTYSLSDNLNESGVLPGDNCPFQLTGSFSGSGPVAMNGSGNPAYGGIAFDSGLTHATLGVHISFDEAQTLTLSGSPPICNPSTSTSTVGLQANPGCYTQTGPVGPGGDLQGTYPNATVNLGCSATVGNQDWTETTTITGSLTITPATTDLQITSPPGNSTIAVTDPNYVTPQPGAADRAPKARILKVAGTTACPGPVTVNGVSVPVSGGAWSAELPITALGPVTLTAKAAGCQRASSTVTLISLDITSPAENTAQPITATPDMPALGATLTVDGYPGDTSNVPFDWTLQALGETVARAGEAGTWTGYSQTAATGTTTGPSETWQPSYDHIVGGIGRLTVTASLPGALDNPVTSDPRWIGIPGTNPPAATAKSFVDQADPHYATTIRHIICIESNWQQFNPEADSRQPAIPGVPADWHPNPGPRQPLYGPPAGIGIAQLDPASLLSPDQYWNWQTNLHGGIALFHTKLQEARAWAAHEQARLTGRLQRALAQANLNRTAQGLPPLHKTVITVPALTDQQAVLQAIRRYNGGNEFHFDTDYVLSSNNINVNLVGTQAWVEPPAGYWGHAPADLHLRQPWVALASQFQGYVKSVLNCKNS